MKTTFRLKLLTIFGAALLALVATLVVSVVMGVQQANGLDEVQSRLLPKAELGPRLQTDFERLARALQDAVAAQDEAALEATAEQKAALFETIAGAGSAIEPASAAAIRWAVQDYYQTARDVSRRMIAGETGEAILQNVALMQAQQRRAQALIKQTTGLDRHVLSGAFDNLRINAKHANQLRLGITGAGVLAVAWLALWGAQGLLRALQELIAGLARFGTGDFRTPIPLTGHDELSIVASQANQMAANLLQLSDERERADWLKNGIAGLSDQLRGDLEPRVAAERTLAFLLERVHALAGALYLVDDDGKLTLEALCAGAEGFQDASAAARFAAGQGLVGQALLANDLSVVNDVPSDHWKLLSAFGESTPRQLVFVPLSDQEQSAGVLELALLEPLTDAARDLLAAVRPQLVIAMMAARAGAARKKLLKETQQQAEQLTAQEEELRLNNQELLAQQEELRHANAELEAQRTELARQNEALEKAQNVLGEKADELKRVSAYKSQFLANMSHELRTPLNSMLLLSQLLAENDGGNLGSKQIEHLRTIHAAGQDLLSLINEVLDLSKIEAGKQDVRLETVDLQHFAAFARRLFEVTATQKGLKLEIEIDAAAPAQLVTDRQRLERILLNLLGNALKFTEHGKVALWLGRPSGPAARIVDGPAVAMVVSDTGVGIPEQARERVFAPFEQVQGASSRGHAGTGLGLAIARESARLLGGELMLEDSSQRGSRFVCVVPERTHVATSPAGRPTLTVIDDSRQLAEGEPHLLIIEDDPVLAEHLVEIAHARQLKVLVVSSGAEGLRIARGGRTLGIVLDVKLPDIDGWSVMEQLKRDSVTRAIPVHFVSGVDEPQRGLALGAVGYLVKPASHADLAHAVRALVPAKTQSRGVLVVEDDQDHGTAILAVVERAGFRGAHVRTAAAALEQLGTGEFGCMILDLGLPDMDGLRLLEALRARPELGSPRIVIHTGRSLSKQELREIEAYSAAIVLKDGHSAERLLDEVRLFVRHVTGSGTPQHTDPPARKDTSLRGIKLLLAEDDMRTAYSLSALLRGKGADVVTAETGAEALAALAQHADIQGVLMDVMMPEMDGYEAMRRLRRQPRYASLPVIALTAKAMKGERERCLEAGASDYLPKPVDSEKLLSTLQHWLRAGAA
ncbi:MAG TPA: response regulator [Polyangiaceae bacterium]|nr:response regulator [Polyangiaceae bacterium]